MNVIPTSFDLKLTQLDVLCEQQDLRNIDWNLLFERFDHWYYYSSYMMCCEEITKIETKITLPGGIGDRFKIDITPEIYFTCDIVYIDASKYIAKYSYEAVRNKTNEFQQFYGYIKDNNSKKIISVSFKDQNNSMVVTNAVGNHAFAVMKSVINSVKRSIADRNKMDDIIGIVFLVTKNEPKKKELFKRLLENNNTLPGLNFTTTYIDESDPNYWMIFRY